MVAFEQWRVYLEGSKHVVQVWTDHKNLIYWTTTKILTRRQVRWTETLAAYNFQIAYRKGSENARADALSRRTDYVAGQERPRAMLKATDEGLTYNSILATIAVVEDTELEKKLKDCYQTDEPARRTVAQPKDATSDFTIDEQGLICFQGLIYMPHQIRHELVDKIHSLLAYGHQGIDEMQEHIK